MNRYLEAFEFAKQRHEGQLRKYTGEPYINHCIAVVEQLIKWEFGDRETMLTAAILHDVVEDTDTTLQEVRERFGDTVAELVYWLTDFPSDKSGNRKTRTTMSAWRLSQAPFYAQVIKLADLMDNTKSIVQHDPKFAATYLAEKEVVLSYMVARGFVATKLIEEVRNTIKGDKGHE